MSARETATGKFYMNNEKIIEVPENPFTKDLERQKDEKAAQETMNLYKELAQKKQDDINKKLETLEILPIGTNIIILPYPENPYKKVINGNIILDYSGQFLNPDSGEIDKKQEFVRCAKVIEVGPMCKYIKKGDDVYYLPGSSYPIPFMSVGYMTTNEPNILCVLNEKLTERFNEIKK